MNKQQLASKIWSGANALRGKVSADSYKDYMLGFIFYKYISNKEEEYLKNNLYYNEEELKKLDENEIDTVNNCKENLGYFISYNNMFSTWIKNAKDLQIRDIRTALSAFNRNIGSDYAKVYDNIFDTLEKGIDSLGTNDTERTKSIRKLLELIFEIPTDSNQNYDVLGFVYEFLLKNFAANAGKAGEFYTPHEASLIMSEIVANHLKDKKEISIYDPTSGSGSLLINIGQTVAKHMEQKNKIKYYAQELIENTYNLTRMNLIMRDVLPSNIIVRNGDTLGADWPFFEENDRERTYDPVFVNAAISNPPYSQTWDRDNADNDIRFSEYGLAPKSKADYAFLLHNLYHLKPDGIITIVLPHGVLFRGGDEKDIRKKLIDKNNIETIIGLPANMFFGTGIPTIIMVLKKNRQNDDILFVDASKGFVKDGNKNTLKDKDVRKILDTVFERKTVEKYSKLVTKEEIIKNDYNLNIPRYVDSSDDEDIHDIYASIYGGIPNYEIDSLNEFWNVFPSLKKDIFSQKEIPYSTIKDINIKEIIESNSEVNNFIDEYKSKFKDLVSFLENELVKNNQTINIYKEKEKIIENIKERFKEIILIDYYDAYQVFSDNWENIALDLEVLQKDGIKVLNEIEPNISYKKNKQKELEEVQNGYVGRILPYELIQKNFFANELDMYTNLSNELNELENTKNEYLERIDPNDKENLLKEDSEDIDSKKLNKIIKKIQKEVKNGAEYEDGTYETIILNIAETNEKIKSNKKIIKEIKTKLEIETKNKIETLPIEDALKLLTDKWIRPIYSGIINLGEILKNDLIKNIEYLNKKYDVSLQCIESDIIQVEKELSQMLEELKCVDEFDAKGIEEFKSLIGGNLDE